MAFSILLRLPSFCSKLASVALPHHKPRRNHNKASLTAPSSQTSALFCLISRREAAISHCPTAPSQLPLSTHSSLSPSLSPCPDSQDLQILEQRIYPHCFSECVNSRRPNQL